MMDKVDKMIIGGAMANTFLKAQGYAVGTSRVEDDLLDTASELIAKAKILGVKLYLPVDCIVADAFAPKAETKRTTVQEVPQNWMILDIGPATTMLFGEALEDARTIIWNGPMGAFEMDAFSRGTMAMVQKLRTWQYTRPVNLTIYPIYQPEAVPFSCLWKGRCYRELQRWKKSEKVKLKMKNVFLILNF